MGRARPRGFQKRRRLRILEAAVRLGYRRNAAALGLNRRNMNTLGVISVVDGKESTCDFEVLNGILETAAEHGQNTTRIFYRGLGAGRATAFWTSATGALTA